MRFLRLVFFIICYSLTALAVIAGLVIVDGGINKPLQLKEESALLSVPPGSSVQQIGQNLEKRGWLSDGRWFSWYARFTGKSSKVQAGEFQIEKGTNVPELLEQLIDGKAVQYSITLVEGSSFKELMAQIRSSAVLKQTISSTATAEEVMAAIGHAGEHPEGRFLPETYKFPRGSSDVAFLKRAYDDMAVALESAWQARDESLPYANAYEALIMASIVEKETGQAFERPQIAGVFVRRLQKGMRLQTDPTIIYGMGDRYDGNIRRKDIREATAYNTYVIRGMPPTPIAMPGRAAIDAALHPAAGNSLYFVSKNDGTHAFSATLAEHERYVDKYQRGR